ncbi:MAG TPA: leucyl/phenylalanyl-tRNA--protein transferase [Dokdonella sp.]|uniref:leucyl/phenylalanyl-tRNA--protein transferase n=1 Tax=Dokdonella sp. TaxID=2291710 RepID=UPI002BD5C27A|nr:leucyl/phenylalanyl-tRNA--protein transferase [Dokdonella sp.]HUD40415.1 leucyl/phenylalanyl-tRNA--protein transferase [Dokdonella sp.]
MIRIPMLSPSRLDPFPPVATALREPDGLLAAGGDLSVERLLAAYAGGIFPWFSAGEPILWWSPDPRMVFDTGAMHVPRRLRRWLRGCDWTIGADSAFAEVMHACAAPRSGQDGTWIGPEMHAAYARLHAHGHAHSIEVRDGGVLVGGLYGVAVGRMFFGESMFSRASGGSKVALLALAQVLNGWGWPLLDAQVRSPHLATLGARTMPRQRFVATVRELAGLPGRSGSWTALFPALTGAALAAG